MMTLEWTRTAETELTNAGTRLWSAQEDYHPHMSCWPRRTENQTVTREQMAH